MTGITKLAKLHVVNATKQHTASLFFFHGSGSSGDDVKQWIDILNRGELAFPHIKIIYPTAPAQPYTPNYGMISNVWFNRKSIAIDVPEEVESVDSMCNTVSELIEKEVSEGIPYDRIAVGGFSMGGALALHLAYRFKTSLAGCSAMSSFLNENSVVYEHLKTQSTGEKPPLLQFHGALDELVPMEWGQTTYDNLKELGVSTEFVQLDNAEHELTRKEIQTFKDWLLKILPEK